MLLFGRNGPSAPPSVCIGRRTSGSSFSALAACRERLAGHGSGVLVAVADEADATLVRWMTLGEMLPHYWLTVFPEELPAWSIAARDQA